MNNSSLHKQLLITIVVLMLFVSSAIVWISIQAGTDAVNQLTQRVMSNMIERISSDNEKQLNNAVIALETVAPSTINNSPTHVFDTNLDSLEQRLWAASGLFMQASNYVYFAAPDGRFVGVNRLDAEHVELYVQQPGDPLRIEYSTSRPGDHNFFLSSGLYDARTRSWYVDALKHNAPVWTDIYNKYTRPEPTITLAKAVYQPDHSLAGVVATDIPLRKLSDNLRGLNISANSVAFIVDKNGDLIATSSEEPSFIEVDRVPTRLSAATINNKLINAAYSNTIKDKTKALTLSFPANSSFQYGDEKIDVAFAPLANKYGLNWVTVVAIPRTDFMGGITHSLFQSAMIVVLCVMFALFIGLAFIEHILRDIRQLTSAAKKMGNGEPLPRLRIHRKDEIGHLINTFVEMENKLRFDRLTQIYNREFLIAQIEFLERHALQHPKENVCFTLLFLDLDRFKVINDTYGHAAGDQLLIVIAARLKSAVRDTDTVARYGGDEFVVLLNGTSNATDIQMTVDKIHTLVQQPIALSDHIVAVHVSVGWAVFPHEALDYNNLLKIADSRMFNTKKERPELHLRLVE
ncbi:sensor domain-containing diguanylate cyclase [Sapientia aquatica]|nr:sensor domain-containing diguanylate cyclase [Sapientia aquatica]